MTIKVYGGVLSGRTARVLAVLFEKDVTDFELVPVSIDTSPEEVPEFLKTQVSLSSIFNLLLQRSLGSFLGIVSTLLEAYRL